MEIKKEVWILLGFGFLFLGAKSVGKKFSRPLKGKVGSGFGWRIDPVYGGKEWHNGVDIGAPFGTPIAAIAEGKVVSVYEDEKLGGKQIRLKHTNGWASGYAHMSQQLVKVGEKVERGSIIGLVGSTGKSTGNHLHLTLTDPEGNKVDPEKYIKFQS